MIFSFQELSSRTLIIVGSEDSSTEQCQLILNGEMPNVMFWPFGVTSTMMLTYLLIEILISSNKVGGGRSSIL